MNWAMFALGLFLGCCGGIFLAALLHATDEPDCAALPEYRMGRRVELRFAGRHGTWLAGRDARTARVLDSHL